MSKKVYLDAPDLGKSEKKYLAKAIESGFVSSIGPFVPELEERFARYLGIKNAVSTQSGTAALHMALYEFGIGRGDEVIVPALTFIATVNPVVYLGAKPVFADVDIDTWNISPEEIKRNITRRTKAIIVVHLYGNPCNMDEIMKVAKRYNLFVIEDATESLGAKYKGLHTGTFGDFGCFSFNGNKVITTGGGGMVVGKNKKRLEHIKFLVNQARDESKGYYHPEIGFNYRMTNIEAALGLAQIGRLNKFLRKKKNFYAIYRNELANIRGIRFQEEYPRAEHSHWLTCVTFEERVDLNKLQKAMKDKRIPTRRIFMPILEFPPYVIHKKANYKNSYSIYSSGLCLPSSTLNSESAVCRACKIIKGLAK